jgi:hypothetical protein
MSQVLDIIDHNVFMFFIYKKTWPIPLRAGLSDFGAEQMSGVCDEILAIKEKAEQAKPGINLDLVCTPAEQHRPGSTYSLVHRIMKFVHKIMTFDYKITTFRGLSPAKVYLLARARPCAMELKPSIRNVAIIPAGDAHAALCAVFVQRRHCR